MLRSYSTSFASLATLTKPMYQDFASSFKMATTGGRSSSRQTRLKQLLRVSSLFKLNQLAGWTLLVVQVYNTASTYVGNERTEINIMAFNGRWRWFTDLV